jgi:hypothetical protein
MSGPSVQKAIQLMLQLSLTGAEYGGQDRLSPAMLNRRPVLTTMILWYPQTVFMIRHGRGSDVD